jgi:hypothetical protein
MPKLRQPGCDCPGAIVGSASNSGSGPTDFTGTHYFNGGLAVTRPVNVVLSADAIVIKDSFALSFFNAAGGSVGSYAGPCQNGTYNLSVTAPIGSAYLQVFVDAACDPTETDPTAWSYLVEWSDQCV